MDDAERDSRGTSKDAGYGGRQAQDEEDRKIDFSMVEGELIKTRVGRGQVRDILHRPTLEVVTPVEVQAALPSRSQPRCEEDERKEHEVVFDGQKLDIKPSVVITGVRI